MAHAIRIDGRDTSATPNGRLEALKGRNLPTSDNHKPLEDGDLNKIMDRDLFEATIEGDVEKFINALKQVSESRKLALSLIFDQVTPSGNSLLHVAASSESKHVMELILFHYPYLVTRKNSLEDTPLHVAVQDGRLEATRKLIRLRRDSEIVYWKNKDGKSPLYLAVETGCIKILQPLLEVSARDEAYAVKIQGMSPILAAIKKEDTDLLEAIIDQLPKLLHVRDENGGTPWHCAAFVGSVGAVRLLMRKCHYLALQKDKNGSYPIHMACEGGDVDIILELLDVWPDLAEIKNEKGQNILHVAAKGGNKRAVRHILKKCGEPDVIKKLVNSKDVDGNTPLNLASMHNHFEVKLYLTKAQTIRVQLRNNDRSNNLSVATEIFQIVFRKCIEMVVLRSISPQSTRKSSSGESESSRNEQIKKEIGTQLVVATLVASVSFTAGITLPGGYNVAGDPHPGMATMLHNRVFQVFIIFDAMATFTSILSVVTLLRAHNAILRVAEEALEVARPSLLLAVLAMTVAFSAAVILAVSKLTSLAIFLLCFAVPFVAVLFLHIDALSNDLSQGVVDRFHGVVGLLGRFQESRGYFQGLVDRYFLRLVDRLT
ncbi:hypothetical protein ACJRO7_006770 [Eucalyptus globulus]|uniref:PGG domain-containing protein n=1 Tax=Eucalyptus globulus TaxID=34317 RepID=A0ABD3IN12_EUCGL